MPTILVIDDERSMREFLSIMLEKEGYKVVAMDNGNDALDYIRKSGDPLTDSGHGFDLIISDIKMPRISGIEILRESITLHPHTPVIMITAFASTDAAVEAMKLGAYDYITKPFKVDEIKIIIKNALEKKSLFDENISLKEELKGRYQFSNIIGKSDKIQKVFELIMKVANSKSTVLITGESGTGKELVARAIHYNSERKVQPFVSISCSAIPETLLESELFGHQKGAFTGADSEKKGLFEVADGGTFFLDEVSEAPPSIQAKLLRVLQEKEFKRIGGVKDIKVDVRVIAATNKNLHKLIEDGKFREDLYYRLNVIPIELPSLRERKADIPLLVSHFINKYNSMNKKNIKGIRPEAMEKLEKYIWRGNIRELENVIERAVLLETTDNIQIESLPDEIKNYISEPLKTISDIPSDSLNLEDFLSKLEKDIITNALKKTRGVKTKAAELLKMSFRSFRYKLEKYNIENDKG
ncbi:MAG: Fis family transcriptional regulator [Nitrospinae bacterium RIFCSPHIGHO2_02_39_11]|nr:MAG: Fis family transcriptional regulator [Nitrospinae bacterium RIFCSPHIGHO2_02_39_11]